MPQDGSRGAYAVQMYQRMATEMWMSYNAICSGMLLAWMK
jgi:hypothetical protein